MLLADKPTGRYQMVVTASEMPEKFIVPTTTVDAMITQNRIAKLLIEIAAETAKLAEAKRQLDEEYERRLAPLRAKAVGWSQAMHEFAENNRAVLTQAESRKTVRLGNAGEIRWYFKPKKVHLTVKPADLIRELRKRRLLKKFTRVKREIDKDALLDEPDLACSIPGVEIVGGEKFAIKPTGTLAHVERDSNGTWSVVIDEDKKRVE